MPSGFVIIFIAWLKGNLSSNLATLSRHFHMRQTAARVQLAQENPAPELGAQLPKPAVPMVLAQLTSLFTFL